MLVFIEQDAEQPIPHVQFLLIEEEKKTIVSTTNTIACIKQSKV